MIPILFTTQEWSVSTLKQSITVKFTIADRILGRGIWLLVNG